MDNMPDQLETPRLILRPYEFDDAAALVAIFSNPLNTKYDPHKNGPDDTTVPEYERHIQKWREEASKGEKALLAITLKDTKGDDTHNPVIGMSGYPWLPANANGRPGNTGVLIDSAYARKGYGSEALAAVLDYGFQKLGFERIEQCTQAANEPYRNLMVSMGLERFGREQPSPDDEGTVEWCYTLTNSDWEAVKKMHNATDQ